MNSQKSSNHHLPQVIFLDAMGTLFSIKESIGTIYQAIAKNYGVTVNASSIDRAFADSFKIAPPLAFDVTENEQQIYQQEFNWWKKVVRQTFDRLEKLSDFTDFPLFFNELYTYFATDKPWYIYPDVVPCLQNWQQQGIQLGIISNFDSRLYKVLKLLKIRHFFDSITISSEAGFAKPDPNIFQIALKKHNCISQQAWHIGDSFTDDYQGALAAEIKSFWLNRFQPSVKHENQLPNLISLG